MRGNLPKIIILSLVVLGTATSGVFVWQAKRAIDQLPELPPLGKRAGKHAEEHGAEHAAAEKAGGHGAAKEASGHGEAPKAEGHGETAKAEGHGEAPKGEGHGEARAPASQPNKGLPLYTIDELYVNVASEVGAHTLGMKLEIEMFDEKNRSLLDSRQAAIRNKIIEAARDQDYLKLGSMAGKLYFKEILVGHLNEYFQQALIKDVHFSLFYLQ